MEINIRYGKVSRAQSTASQNFLGLSVKPPAISVITLGIKISINTVRRIRKTNSIPSTFSANSFAALLPLFVSSPANKGTNAALNAPSANNLRKTLGNCRATKKTSETMLAPKRRAIKISLKQPNTRLAIVPPPMVAMDL